MKESVGIALFLALTFFCIFIPWKEVAKANDIQQISVGPNKVESLSIGSKISTNSDCAFTFRQYTYFELQGNGIKQSELKPPAVGETQSRYWIENLPLDGQWTVRSSVTDVYCPTGPAVLTVIPSPVDKFLNILLGVCLGLFCWLLGIAFINRFLM